MPARRSNTCRASRLRAVRSASGSLASAVSSATERQSQDGTSFSSTRFRRAGTPALRKYFWARMSPATWLQRAGTSMSLELEDDRAVRVADLARSPCGTRCPRRPTALQPCSAARSASLCSTMYLRIFAQKIRAGPRPTRLLRTRNDALPRHPGDRPRSPHPSRSGRLRPSDRVTCPYVTQSLETRSTLLPPGSA